MKFEKFTGNSKHRCVAYYPSQLRLTNAVISDYNPQDKEYCSLFFDKESNRIAIQFHEFCPSDGSGCKVTIRKEKGAYSYISTGNFFRKHNLAKVNVQHYVARLENVDGYEMVVLYPTDTNK